MNVKPPREGFIEEDQVEVLPRDKEEAPKKQRPSPPPQIEDSPVDLPPLQIDEWPVIVKLVNKSIKDNRGNDVKELSLREPRAGDINRYGNPVRVNAEGDVIIDERKMTYMIAALSNILPPFIDEMDPRDWNSCAYRLRRFFLPDPAAW